MSAIKHRCPNPKCRVVLAVDCQKHWHRVRCSACGQSFTVPPAAGAGRDLRIKKAS